MATLKSTAARGASRAARGASRAARATRNTWMERATRAGYIARGLLYGSMGVLALVALATQSGTYADQQGDLRLLAGGPIGKVLLVVLLMGLAAYSLWGFIRAVFDPLRRGDDAIGLAERAGFAWSGLSYAALLCFGVQLILGGSRSDNDSIQRIVQTLLDKPGGAWVTAGAGLVAIGAGLAQFYEAVTAGFKEYMRRRTMKKPERIGSEWLGRMGMFARGVIFTLIGWFMLLAAIWRDPAQAHGIGGSLGQLAAAPAGSLMLPIVALGLVALGLHSFANARWGRLEKG